MVKPLSLAEPRCVSSRIGVCEFAHLRVKLRTLNEIARLSERDRLQRLLSAIQSW